MASCVSQTLHRWPPKTRTGRDEVRTLPRLAACSGEGLGIRVPRGTAQPPPKLFRKLFM